MAHALEVPQEAFAWELRGAWATGRKLSLRLDPEVAELSVDRVRGRVLHVSPNDLFVIMEDAFGEIHVPLAAVLSIRRPHFAEPADVETAPDLLDEVIPGQTSFI